jgi:hypothetical protein
MNSNSMQTISGNESLNNSGNQGGISRLIKKEPQISFIAGHNNAFYLGGSSPEHHSIAQQHAEHDDILMAP